MTAVRQILSLLVLLLLLTAPDMVASKKRWRHKNSPRRSATFRMVPPKSQRRHSNRSWSGFSSFSSRNPLDSAPAYYLPAPTPRWLPDLPLRRSDEVFAPASVWGQPTFADSLASDAYAFRRRDSPFDWHLPRGQSDLLPFGYQSAPFGARWL